MVNTKYIEWNTGRQYDDRGQLMRAKFLDSGLALAFSDLSRRIDGVIHGQFGRLASQGTAWEIKDMVMVAYDRGLYLHAQTEDERAVLRILA